MYMATCENMPERRWHIMLKSLQRQLLLYMARIARDCLRSCGCLSLSIIAARALHTCGYIAEGVNNVVGTHVVPSISTVRSV